MRRSIYYLLLQLRLLRVFLRTASAAAAVYCHGLLKVGLPEVANNRYIFGRLS